MKEVLVLGIGNRLMMDDGIGVYVVEELKKRNSNSGIRYVIGETDIYYCVSQIEEASFVIIVDAAYLNKEPGAVSTTPLGQVITKSIQPISVHDSNLLDEIKMREKGIKGVFIGIAPNEINYSTSLSTKLQAQFIKVVEEIEGIIACIINDSPYEHPMKSFL